ncbi:hypothetical protein MHU86_10845 [Fragilaria crotonensis]|nr:hypothetical protein MHU86_10845 [Fragilaria crotonensis]
MVALSFHFWRALTIGEARRRRTLKVATLRCMPGCSQHPPLTRVLRVCCKNYVREKDRAMLDQASCPVSAFYKVAADKFKDTSFIAQVPDKLSLIDGHETIDPNDKDRIMLTGRDGAWFKGASWELYLCPKYRKTLAQWWSDTGGGGGEVENF